MTGINECRITRLLYHPVRSETPQEYELHPYGLIWHRSSLYLVAASPGRSESRHFKVERVRDVEVFAETFTRPTDFDLETHLKNSLGIYLSDLPVTEVRIWFSSEVARYVAEHRWHHSQQIEEQPDGSLLVMLQLNDLTELTSWILGFGTTAVVLTPESLRTTVYENARSLVQLYRRKPARSSIDTRTEDRSRSRKRK
jgi:predicted DNA-binding transcriptional regulator YafY